MKEELCRAFCDGIAVRHVPSGLAVSTPFAMPDGDKIGFYLRKGEGRFSIRDSGLILPTLEASGLDLKNKLRAEALQALEGQYGVVLDEAEREFGIDVDDEAEVPAAALRFVSFLLRVGDLLLLAEERVASTFRADVARMLQEQIGERASISEKVPLLPDLSDFLPDFRIEAGSKLVGVFLGTSDARVLEALYMQMRAEHETHSDLSIVALLEQEKAITARVRQNANNRLDAVPYFRGDEAGAIARIAKEAGLASVH